jgi:hypothetical protein
MSSTSMSVSGVGKDPKALDLFHSSLSASDGEVVAPMPHSKHLHKSRPPKTVLKSFDNPVVKSTSA